MVAMQKDSHPATEACDEIFCHGSIGLRIAAVWYFNVYGATGTIQILGMSMFLQACKDRHACCFVGTWFYSCGIDF